MSSVSFSTTFESVVFFVFHNILFALINLLVIIFFIIVLILKYKDINKLSYYLMIPYLLWSCYALILNFSLLILNFPVFEFAIVPLGAPLSLIKFVKLLVSNPVIPTILFFLSQASKC